MAPDHDLFQTPPLTSLSVYFCSNLPGTLSGYERWPLDEHSYVALDGRSDLLGAPADWYTYISGQAFKGTTTGIAAIRL